jgi:primosomal protein N'
MFPAARVVRLDRDSTRRKGSLEKLLDELIAKDTMAGLGCDNMTSILIRFK